MNSKKNATGNKSIRNNADDFILGLVADPSLIKQGFCPIDKIKLIPNPEATNEEDAYESMWYHGCGKTYSQNESDKTKTKKGRLSSVNSNEESESESILEILGTTRGSARKLKRKRNPHYENIEGLTPDRIPKLDKDHGDSDLLYHANQGATILSVVDAEIIEQEDE